MSQEIQTISSPEEQMGNFYKNYLTEEKLLGLTDAVALDRILYLELKVDSRLTGVGDLAGKLVPKLLQLKLNNSHVPIFRDLGTGYANLNVLWMARCSLSDCQGIGSLSNLKELYLAFNEIKDISPICMLESLEILDLESNEISDFEQIEYLTMCPNLVNLTLEGNPLNELKDENYMVVIAQLIPQVKIIDNVPKEHGVPQQRPKTSLGRPANESVDSFQVMRPCSAIPPKTEDRESNARENIVKHTRFRRKTMDKVTDVQPLLPIPPPGVPNPSRRKISSDKSTQGKLLLPMLYDKPLVSAPSQPKNPKLYVFRRGSKIKEPKEFVELSAIASERIVGTLGRSH